MYRLTRTLLFVIVATLVGGIVPPPVAAADLGVIVPRRIELSAAGINARVHPLRCGIERLPDGRIYDWRCAPSSNRVLLAHAYAAFRPLSRAYDRGALRRGRLLVVTDAHGHRHRYRLAWARVVPSSMVYRGLDAWFWAFTSTARPAMTLITCRGARSQSRLVVRFYAER